MGRSKGVNISFLHEPVSTERGGNFSDQYEGLRYYEDCARLSLTLQGKPQSEAEVANETSAIIDSATMRARIANIGFDLGNSDGPTDLDVMTAARSNLLTRVQTYDPAANDGRFLAFYITPETRANMEQQRVAIESARPAYRADGFDL